MDLLYLIGNKKILPVLLINNRITRFIFYAGFFVGPPLQDYKLLSPYLQSNKTAKQDENDIGLSGHFRIEWLLGFYRIFFLPSTK